MTCGISTCWMLTVRLAYNFGALLRTTGVGSELYDFSGISFCCCCIPCCGINVDMNAGCEAAVAAAVMSAADSGDGAIADIGIEDDGCCCSFCCV